MIESYFLAGCIFLAFEVVALFFLKFWSRGRDPFFLMFAMAFFLLGVERLCIIFFVGSTTGSYVYLIRLFAFCLILAAVVRKNTPQR